MPRAGTVAPTALGTRAEANPPSPRLSAFVRAASRGGRGIPKPAWARLVRDGVPVVERVAGDPNARRVTFVWRPRGPVDHPAIYTPIANPTKGETALLRAGGTDVWWRSMVVPRGTRALYAFSRTAMPGPSAGGAEWAKFFRSLIADPLQPARLTMARDPDTPGDTDVPVSVLSLPGAPSWPTLRGARGPPLARFTLPSAHLPGVRSVWVGRPRRPPSARRPLRLVIAFDGVVYQSAIPTPWIVRDLERRGAIGPTAVVLVGNAAHAREEELAHNPGFVRFLVDELLPWLRARHAIDVPAERTVLVGSSFGGLAAAYAAVAAPDRFGNVLAQSGAFLWRRSGREVALPPLFEEYARAPRARTRFFLEVGRLESVVYPGMSQSLLDGVREFRDLLRARGYTVRYAEFVGGHDYACWAVGLGAGLRFLLGERREPAGVLSPGAGRTAPPGRLARSR
jgi:enterochelin esterase-like enzyme